ncbi:putative F-box domain, kelch-type beta propeller, F-box associated interaction [Helianthus anomalus]
MLGNFPFEIQLEITKRVPVKSLIPLSCVSNQCKSLIDSPEFIADQTNLVVRVKVGSEETYFSDDDGVTHLSFSPIIPPSIKLGTILSFLGCSHGLVGMHGVYRYKEVRCKMDVRGEVRCHMVVLWNPSIRKSVGIEIRREFDVIGFGVCPRTRDPKIIAINNSSPSKAAEVYTLSSRAWRSISTTNLQRWPLSSVSHSSKPVVIDGVVHWIVCDTFPRRIVSFDLTSDEFSEVELPDDFAHPSYLSILNFKGSLAVLVYPEAELFCDVWTVGHPSSCFTKVSTVSLSRGGERVIGFRKNGQIITEHVSIMPDQSQVTTLEAYSEHNNHHHLASVAFNSYILKTSYAKSLLLLNHSDSAILWL